MNIKDFFYDYFDVPSLQWILEEKLGLPISGRKVDLIDRIVDNERFHPDRLFKWLSHEELKNLCCEMRLKVSGNKKTLWIRILEETKYFDNTYPDLKTTHKRRKKLAERQTILHPKPNNSIREDYVEIKSQDIQLEPRRFIQPIQSFRTRLTIYSAIVLIAVLLFIMEILGFYPEEIKYLTGMLSRLGGAAAFLILIADCLLERRKK